MSGKIESRERRIYFDSCVYIKLLEPTNFPIANAIADVVRFAGFHGTRIVTSELSIAECLMRPVEIAIQTGNNREYDLYEDRIFSKESRFQDLVPVTREVITLSAHLRAELRQRKNLGLKLPDATHLASVLVGDCDTIVTGDQQMLRAAREIMSYRPRSGKVACRLTSVIPLEIESLAALKSELPEP